MSVINILEGAVIVLGFIIPLAIFSFISGITLALIIRYIHKSITGENTERFIIGAEELKSKETRSKLIAVGLVASILTLMNGTLAFIVGLLESTEQSLYIVLTINNTMYINIASIGLLVTLCFICEVVAAIVRGRRCKV